MTLMHTPVLDEKGESQEGTEAEEVADETDEQAKGPSKTTLRIKVENGMLNTLIISNTQVVEVIRNLISVSIFAIINCKMEMHVGISHFLTHNF